jgi:hypothetical protein
MNIVGVCYFCKRKKPTKSKLCQTGSFSWQGDGWEYVEVCKDCEDKRDKRGTLADRGFADLPDGPGLR